MSTYTVSYSIRYEIPSLQQQTEVAMVSSANYILIEAPETPDHANRLLWANWALKNSSVAWISFAWPVALDPTVQAAVEADPSGATVTDESVNAVVGAALPTVIADYIASITPPAMRKAEDSTPPPPIPNRIPGT
jgi:hypothetical protein